MKNCILLSDEKKEINQNAQKSQSNVFDKNKTFADD
jgi:hypothetical protein